MNRGWEFTRAAGLVLVACFFCSDRSLAAESLIWQHVAAPKPSVLATGLDAGSWSRDRLQVRVLLDGIGAEDLPPLVGVYSRTAKGLEFTPRFPLTPGMTYEATLHGVEGVARALLTVPVKPAVSRARVAAVYPGASVLPENLLKFYLHFSHPMSRGDIYQHITLLDDAEQPVELPFLEIGEELWNPDQTRLTLLIDPGRIKRGVKPLEEIGPSMTEGRRYTLHISREWQDAEGAPMKDEFRKSFIVGPADRTPPDPIEWKLRLPAIGTRQPLTVQFSEAMDHALAIRVVWIETDGVIVRGQVMLADGESRWTLIPDQPWKAGSYSLKAATILEDLAGNSLGRPFEVDVFERVDTDVKELPFVRMFTLGGR